MEIFDPTNAEMWVAVGLLIFIGLMLYLKIPAMVAKGLDSRGAAIQAQLDEAQQLRAEAQALLDSIRVQRDEAEKLATQMLKDAQAEAKRLEADAKVRLEEQIVRRSELATRRIALAETQAAAEVKAAAADMAAQMAETVLIKRLDGAKSDPLIDQGIKQMAGRFQ